MIEGWRCVVCESFVGIAIPFSWRCPRATTTDRRHVLSLVERPADRPGDDPHDSDDPNPYVRFGRRLAWWTFARANGLSEHDCLVLTREVADGFEVTPYEHSDALSNELGLEVWVKDETSNVAGSHKARHLVTIMLHLRAAEVLGLLPERPPLAIASCGNAALAAATLAWRAGWPLRVFVPEWMDEAFGERLVDLGAEVERCPRRSGDPPGDPAMHRFRAAVDGGALPFTVQGPENAWCLDGGRTLGWEIAESGDPMPARVWAQVGGGAFAACLGTALGPSVVLHAVQASGCAPLVRAWSAAGGIETVNDIARRWSELMTPWEDPWSVADGILDDETYDWLQVVAVMRAGGGAPVVATEDDIHRANQLAHRAGFATSYTGSAGLAGLLAARSEITDGERVAVVMTGGRLALE